MVCLLPHWHKILIHSVLPFGYDRAIDIAEKFPDAQVTAVDIGPILPRPVPSNFQFQRCDILADPLPWEPSSFDVVHFRFLLIHLPDPQRVLERVVRLVKPGGWFIAEEVTMSDDVKGDAPAVRAAYSMLCKYWESNGQVPRVGERLESWLREAGLFSEVNVHEVTIPMGNRWCAAEAQNPVQQQEAQVVDPKSKALGLTFTDTGRRSFSDRGMLVIGSTPELQSQCLEQFNTAEWRMNTPLHFVWARKSSMESA